MHRTENAADDTIRIPLTAINLTPRKWMYTVYSYGVGLHAHLLDGLADLIAGLKSWLVIRDSPVP